MDDKVYISSFTHSDSILHEAQKFLQYKKSEGTIIFAMITGSHSYNLSFNSSDVDYLGVYLTPTAKLLSLESDSIQPTLATTPADPEPDFTLHEGKTFCQQLLRGNPFIIEMIYCERYCYETDAWKKLKQYRRLFLTKQVVEEHLSYIRNQIDRHKKKNLPGKRVYHMLRLLFTVQRIIDGKEPKIFIEDSDDHTIEPNETIDSRFQNKRQLLLRIKRGECSDEEFEELVQKTIDSIEKQRPWPNLPDTADEQLLEQWLIELRKSDFLATVAQRQQSL